MAVVEISSQKGIEMIVCICRGVSDRTINAMIDDGARSIADLKRCGVGDQCGSCHSQLRTMLAEAAAARAAQPIPCPACTSSIEVAVATA